MFFLDEAIIDAITQKDYVRKYGSNYYLIDIEN